MSEQEAARMLFTSDDRSMERGRDDAAPAEPEALVDELSLDDAATPEDERPLVNDCPVCHSRRLHYAFSIGGEQQAGSRHPSHRVVRCADCSLMLLNPQPSDTELAEIYGARYFIGQSQSERDGPDAAHVAQM